MSGALDALLPTNTTENLILLNPGAKRAGNRGNMIASGLAVSGTNLKVIQGGFKLNKLAVAAATAAVAATAETPLIQVTTNGAQACTVTLPEAANNIGAIFAIEFVTDGGADLTVARTGSDTFDESGDIGNTQWTTSTAGHTLVVLAVSDNKWLILSRIGGTLS